MTIPKIYLAAGNCLMGRIVDKQTMTLAWLGSAGVDQMIGQQEQRGNVPFVDFQHLIQERDHL